MANPTYIINDYWLKELVLNHNPDLKNFHKEDLIKMIHFCTEEISKYKEEIEQKCRESEQYRLSYENALKEDFKDDLLKGIYKIRQILFNARSCNPRKQDLLDGINYAIKISDEIIVLKEVE